MVRLLRDRARVEWRLADITSIDLQIQEHDDFGQQDDCWNIDGMEILMWQPNQPSKCVYDFEQLAQMSGVSPGDPAVRLCGNPQAYTPANCQ